MFIRNIGLGFPFFVVSLTGSGICFFFVVVLTWSIFGSFPFSSFFFWWGGSILKRNRSYLFFKCLVEFTCESVWSWTFVGSYLITDSIVLLVIGLFRWSVSS